MFVLFVLPFLEIHLLLFLNSLWSNYIFYIFFQILLEYYFLLRYIHFEYYNLHRKIKVEENYSFMLESFFKQIIIFYLNKFVV